MDVIKFNPEVGSSSLFTNGSMVEGITSKLWVERYKGAGEFEFTAPIGSDLRNKLPIGSHVTHLQTQEIMVVENHEISEGEEEVDVKVTGRSLVTLLEQRTLGCDLLAGNANVKVNYSLASGALSTQIITLIRDHTSSLEVNTAENALVSVYADEDIVAARAYLPLEERPLDPGSLYKATLDLMHLGDYGLKTIRPGPYIPVTLPAQYSDAAVLLLHNGKDLTSSVVFSYDLAEVDAAQYLWSDKELKNVAHVQSKWLETVTSSAVLNNARRFMRVDASDLDEAYSVAPTGATKTAILNQMLTRGQQALASQKTIVLNKAEVSEDSRRYLYRRDFNIGDIIAVDGNFDQTTNLRVIEYVETEDENGDNNYPTLSGLD